MPIDLALLFALILALAYGIFRYLRWRRERMLPYTPALARIEGGGVKRGLTPAEGAVLLGRPLHVTLTLVIFEMLRKGFLRQVAAEPLTVEVAEAFRTHNRGLSPQARGDQRRAAAQAINATLHLYEEPFLEIIEAHPGRPVAELDLGVAVQPLVRYVAGRVGGYSLEESREYYRLIIERAPREARSDGRLTFERQKVLDRNFGWVLLGEDFAAVLDAPELSYLPLWLRPPRAAVDELGGRSFAAWAQAVMDSLAGVVAEDDVRLTLGREEDATTATLLSDITRTTFYG
ncbi:MAG: hypothetical protein KIS85_05705 [Anaerolineales bacterium]|nr:hypothetical protein [Anaerolineales bacterium]